MILKTKLFGKVYEFKSLREVMAKANEEKSGDKLAGIAAESAEERVAAKVVLSHITLQDLRNNPAVPYEEDEVTRIIQDGVDEAVAVLDFAAETAKRSGYVLQVELLCDYDTAQRAYEIVSEDYNVTKINNGVFGGQRL